MNYSTTERFSLVREPVPIPNVSVSNADKVADYARSIYETDLELQECFYCIFANVALKTTGYALIGMGGTSTCAVDIKLVAKYAANSLAENCILVHNHPSGNLNPSESDKRLTKKIKKALEYLDIRVVDHVILTKYSHFSFAQEGLI